MNITSRQLKAFLLTARHQSFSRAAERLFITQSGMSVLVRELEDQLGFRLFDRTTRRVTLTEFGTRFLPIAYANSNAAIRSINPELEDAVRILGGSRFTAIWRVVIPLLKRSLAGAFILVFIPATRELSAAIFLYSINTQVLSVLLFDKSDEGNFEMLAAIGLILVFITVVLILVGFRLMGRDFMLRRTAA